MLRVGLSSNHLRVISDNRIKAAHMKQCLQEDGGFQGIKITPTTPDLEDVFLALAKVE